MQGSWFLQAYFTNIRAQTLRRAVGIYNANRQKCGHCQQTPYERRVSQLGPAVPPAPAAVPSATPLHRLHPRLERLEPCTSALQHPALRIELFTSDEIELPEARTQHRAKITLEIALGRAQRRRQIVHESVFQEISRKSGKIILCFSRTLPIPSSSRA